ncbi:MAG: hypothetical protein ACKVZ6_13025 [Kineosporiaceae bacterium]
MTPTTLHPSVIRHRAAAQPDAVPVTGVPAFGAPFVADHDRAGSGSDGTDGTDDDGRPRFPLWLVALVIGAFVAIVAGALAGAIYGPDPGRGGVVTGIADGEGLRPGATPTASTTSGTTGRAAGGAVSTGKATSGSGGAGSGGGSDDASAATDPDSDTGNDTGSTSTGTADPGSSEPAADPGDFSIVSPGSGTRRAGRPIDLEVTAVLPDGGGAVPDADIHWTVTRGPSDTLVYEHTGATAVVPGGLVAAGLHTVKVHIESGGLVGTRHVSFPVVAGPTLTLAPAADPVSPKPTAVLDPVGDLTVPVIAPKP